MRSMLRLAVLLLVLGMVTAVAAGPGPSEAAAELQLFLRKHIQADHRVLSFAVTGGKDVSPMRRVISYRARIEFPHGLNPAARAALRNEKVTVRQGSIEALSSQKIVLDLERDAKFVRAQNRWAAQVGTTRYLLPQEAGR
jgi:hypothetical protein